MRLQSWLTALLLSIVCLVPRSSYADTLLLTAVPGGSTDGNFIFPYVFTVTNSSGTQPGVLMACLTFNRDVIVGETWAVVPLSLSSVNPAGTYDGESGASLLEDAWLFNQFGTAAGTDSEIQFAIWSIMDPIDINASNPGFNGANAFDATAQALAANAIAAVTGKSLLPPGYFADVVAYLPDPAGSSTWTAGEPQITLTVLPSAPAPEPSSLLLLGTGFAMFAIRVVTSRRRHAAGKSIE